jgi:subtilisin family serine protease
MGIPYFSSAGNFAADAHERSYVDANAPADDMSFPLPTGIDFHDFGVASGMAADRHFTVTLPSGGQIVAELHWDEPYGGVLGAGPGSAADLDLYLVNSLVLPLNPGNIVKSSTNPQGTIASPAGDAVEEIVETVAPGVYHLCIEHYAGRDDTAPIPLTIHLLVRVNGLGAVITDAAYLGDRTVYGHAAAENVQAIAAMDCREEPLGNFTAPPVQLDVESFSSLGGALPFWFPDTGTPRNVAAQTRNKPELTGIDGTDNTFFGTDVEPNGWPNFFGTSAAAPHVAAIAALMLDQADNNAQSPTPAAIYSIMQSTARDAEAVGWDSLSGFGLVDANAAAGDPGLVPVEFSVFLIE